ncbi:hypothetical protein CS0771_36290 [Catellatospora sp. IY07-71]|uniref:glycosyltransferase n=1 Tax=Catellatospora sp. IY07-71 TaxID=2728827 RepID=UPI001BB44AC8|nr:glycosyltransferase [Catellatospora sp. IY07-71]BCJ74085.1 hypothetical protein CS0771_36290 [Catellatospora sp. IY07-71]
MSDTALAYGGGVLAEHEPAPTTTVVICVYTEQRWPQIVRAVDSVLVQDTPADQIVVVVDHNAPLLERARAAFPGVTVVPSAGPAGLSGARNTGVAYARGDVVAFLDDDAAAEPDWLARMLRHYREPTVVAVGGRAEPAWDGARPRWLPPEFDWVIGCSYTGQPVEVAPVRNVIGCNMSFRRAVLADGDRFDPALGRVGRVPVGCEETELCIRIRQRHPDSVILYDPGALVHHRVTADRATWSYFRRRCFAEGRSKAVVARLVGSGAGLAAERAYTRQALPRGVRQGVRQARAGDRGGLLRAGAIVAGLLVTAWGYATGRALRASRAGTAPPEPSSTAPAAPGLGAAQPVRMLAVELCDGVPELPDGRGPGGGRYAAARVLVRLHGEPLGLLDLELPPGGLAARLHEEAIRQRLGAAIDEHLRADGLPPLDALTPGLAALRGIGAACPARQAPSGPNPFVSVVMPTCGRTPHLARSLGSLSVLDYPNYEIVIVDNAPHVAGTARLVREHAARDARVRYAAEPRAGVTHARNRGLAEARGEIVAYVDDDVTVDPGWLRALAGGFADARVAAVTGDVLASELETPAQVWIEQYGGFGKGCRRRRFDRAGFETAEPAGVTRVAAAPGSLYPYLPGSYGSGANMAFRTEVLRGLGGFDPRLGSRGPVRTGEDIDVLLRTVLSGHTLAYEPAALVWHAHRRELRDLRRSLFHYGVGLSAVMVKCLARDTAGRRDLLRRLPRGIAYALLPRSGKNGHKRGGYPASLTLLELAGMALGPVYYAASAWSARREGR